MRKDGRRREKKFLTRKEAIAWEARMLRKPVAEWSEKTGTASIDDWAQEYLDYAKVRFTEATYKGKRSMFKRFFNEMDLSLPVSKLKPGDVLKYITNQKEARSGYAAIQTILRHKGPSTTERYLNNLGLEKRARCALEELSGKRGQVLEFKPYIQKFAVPSLPK